jgi:hypothetical protein
VAVTWAPALDDVARLIPTRTRDAAVPGDDTLLGTFTTTTTPTAAQAQATIDAAALTVLSQTGPLDAADANLLAQARVAVAWRAAADIELGYPNRDADVHVYDQLDSRAKYELAQLLRRLQAQGEGYAESVPFWSAPDPPVYADRDPGDYTRPLGIWYWSGTDRPVP